MNKPLNAQVWEKQPEGWYVEPPWVSDALFKAIKFEGKVWDPSCGRGNILASAEKHGYFALGSDIVQRCPAALHVDFLNYPYVAVEKESVTNIVCNPPFDHIEAFATKALSIVGNKGKVAMIVPAGRLNAAGAWLTQTPLKLVLYITPRPSMPPGPVYEAYADEGKSPSGGTADFAWVVWYRNPFVRRTVGWLHRDKGLLQ